MDAPTIGAHLSLSNIYDSDDLTVVSELALSDYSELELPPVPSECRLGPRRRAG